MFKQTRLFSAATISEASQTRYEAAVKAASVDHLTADLFAALGLSLVAPGKKGASPAGAAATYARLIQGDKPTGKPSPIVAPGATWATVAQCLFDLVADLAHVGACAAPAPLPTWADPEALAAAKAASAAKAKATKAAKAASAAPADAAPADAEAASADAAPLPDVGAAFNVIMAAAKAGALTADQKTALLAALAAAHVAA